MNDKIISFRLLPPITLSENYIEGGEKYLLFYLLTETDNAQRKGEKTEEHVFLLGRSFPYLIIPDDNSPIVSQIKNRKEKEYFTISLTNLQFKPNFLDGNEGKGPQPFYCDGLLVKDTNQIKKAVANTPSFPEITFKVVGQRKTGHVIGTTYEESFSKYGSYSHILEIEPLDLGIEGLPPIVRIFFDFANSLQPIFFRPLTESRFYNSNILTDSVGKTFVMKVKSWGFGEKRNNFGNDTLNFGGDNSFD
ncbi:3188_t:CDS:1 [Ambispora leptoticha]|uniref:3188_t:CDS:1 n=1 Tax=Ambispora leptoticha TaxID=144679 RepID=A0A9N9EAK8_9GLOM|nr:3188_t:CDS:1 [Ambispora leptoticha]